MYQNSLFLHLRGGRVAGSLCMTSFSEGDQGYHDKTQRGGEGGSKMPKISMMSLFYGRPPRHILHLFYILGQYPIIILLLI